MQQSPKTYGLWHALSIVFVAAGREPSGFAAFTGISPDGLRRYANKVIAIWRTVRAEHEVRLRLTVKRTSRIH